MNKRVNYITVYSLRPVTDLGPKPHYFLTKEKMNIIVVHYEKRKERKHHFLLTTNKDGASISISDDYNHISLHRGRYFNRRIRLSIEDMESFYKNSEVVEIKAGEKPNKFIRDLYISLDLKKLLEKAPKNKFKKNTLKVFEQITMYDLRDEILIYRVL